MTLAAGEARSVTFGSRHGRSVLLVAILASGMGFLDMTIVHVALPRLELDLGGGFATLQWVIDAYLLTLGSLMLVGGGLGDLLGIRRVLCWGILGFALASALCALAPTVEFLILARTLQGVAAALMVPGSLALISSLFVAEQRGRAIGLWAGLSSITALLGPFVGGALVDLSPSGWRLVFTINIPIAAAALLFARSAPAVPGRRRPGAPLREGVDLLGATLTAAGLALIVGALIEADRLGTPATTLGALAGVGLLVAFWFVERRRERSGMPQPMLPPSLWSIRSFTVANVVTFAIYGALNALLLLNAVALQIGLGWSALAAGAAGIPITLVVGLMSARVGRLIPRVGSRPLLTSGCLLMAAGLVWYGQLGPDASYVVDVLPPFLVFSLGLALVVAPVTTTALGDIPVTASGIGSGVNNAVARVAGLVAVAVIPLAAGLTTLSASSGSDVLPGFRRATLMCAALCLTGAALSWFGFARETGKEASAA